MEKLFRVVFYVAIISITFIATTTTVHIEVVENMWDKANHFIAFFTLFILITYGHTKLTTFVKVGVLVGFGIFIEVVQHFIEGRFFSLLDVVADIIGIVLGFMFVYLFNNPLKYKDSIQPKTNEQKRQEIIQNYKTELKDSLDNIQDDKQAYMKKKTQLLHRYSHELAMNVFFSPDEVKEIIIKLSKEH
jgi:VanZ family protein